MKLNPKNVRFCPGCPKDKLSLKAAPQLIITAEKNDVKQVTIINKHKEKATSVSLF